MRRSLIATFGLLAALVPGPAHAAPTPYLAVQDEGPGVTALNLSCGDPKISTTTEYFTHVAGPATPPLGTGSLSVSPLDGYRTGIDFTGGTHEVSEIGTAGNFAVAAYTAGAGMVTGYLRVNAGTNGIFHGLTTGVPLTPGAWTPLDLGTATYAWQTDGGNPAGSQTVAQFVADPTKGSGTFQAAVLVGTCAPGAAAVSLDGLVGFDGFGTQRLFDFEKDYSTSLAIAGPAVITATRPATLTSKLTSTGPEVDKRFVELWAKEYGAAVFKRVAKDKTSFDGSVSRVDSPLRETTYQWRYDGDTFYAPAQSATLTVQVRCRITITAVDRTIKKGQRAVLKGTTTPKKVGVPVKLWRKTATGRKLLKTRMTKADGSYRIAKRLNARGKWRLFVTIQATPGNLAGKSGRVRIRVS